jgi:hypothetical protein
MTGVALDQATMQVVSHGLINTFATIAGEARALRMRLGAGTPAEILLAVELVNRIQEQALEGAALLGDVMRGLPPRAVESVGSGDTTLEDGVIYLP